MKVMWKSKSLGIHLMSNHDPLTPYSAFVVEAASQLLGGNLSQHLLATGSAGSAGSAAAGAEGASGDVGVFGMGAAGSAAGHGKGYKGKKGGKGGKAGDGKGGFIWCDANGWVAKGKEKRDPAAATTPRVKKGLLSLSVTHIDVVFFNVCRLFWPENTSRFPGMKKQR